MFDINLNLNLHNTLQTFGKLFRINRIPKSMEYKSGNIICGIYLNKYCFYTEDYILIAEYDIRSSYKVINYIINCDHNEQLKLDKLINEMIIYIDSKKVKCEMENIKPSKYFILKY